jgi:hypothetical protein
MINNFPPLNQNFTYLQTNRSNDLGSLWSSFNLDFQANIGTMSLGNKLANIETMGVGVFGIPVAFEYAHSRYWSICGSVIYVSDTTDAVDDWDQDTSTGALTTYDYWSDLKVYNNRLWACSNGSLLAKTSSGGSWSDETGAASINGEVQQLAYLKDLNRLYFVEGNYEIGSIDKDELISVAGDYYIDIGNTTGVIGTICASSKSIWIGTTMESSGTDGSTCEILRWDGIDAKADESYKIEASSILSITVYNDIPYAIDSHGRILKYTGFSFEEVQRLPVKRTYLIGASSFSSGSSYGRFVHFNGMIATKNNTLLINVNNLKDDSNDTIYENLPSGVWELDLNNANLTHKHSYTYKTIFSETITDYGQNRVKMVGALYNTEIPENDSSGQPSLLAGAQLYNNSSTLESESEAAIFVDSPPDPSSGFEGQKRGYFVTTFFQSEEIQDKWTRLWTTFSKLKTETDSLYFKYRISEDDPVYATITWTSTTTFTTTTDVSAYGPGVAPFSTTSGGEVEIIQGTGGGSCTHISSITEAAGTYTVTLDTAVTGVTGTAIARFQKWIKLYPADETNFKQYQEIPIEKASVEIQIKGVLEFTGDMEFYKAALWSNEDIKINQ